MNNVLEGHIDGSASRVGIIVSEFNEVISTNLLKGTLKALNDCNVNEKNIFIVKVPGAFEVPLVSLRVAN